MRPPTWEWLQTHPKGRLPPRLGSGDTSPKEGVPLTEAHAHGPSPMDQMSARRMTTGGLAELGLSSQPRDQGERWGDQRAEQSSCPEESEQRREGCTARAASPGPEPQGAGSWDRESSPREEEHVGGGFLGVSGEPARLCWAQR